MANLIKGIDVSRWQGPNINWQLVKSGGYLFSFMKATDGSAYKQQFIDMGIQQAQEAQSAGLKIGYYHFAHPSNFKGLEQDAEDEANYFITTIKSFPKPNFPLVLDFEDEKIALSESEAEKWITVFQSILTNANYEMILYSYRGYLNRTLPSNHKLGALPLWLASYPKNFDKNKSPLNPTGWNSWAIWQYSDNGKVKGITLTGCDLDLMTKEFFDKY